MQGYKWAPIEPLNDKERGMRSDEIVSLREAWLATRARLQESGPANLDEFNKRLVRRLSIETGIIEHLYELDLGTTETLVAEGFLEEHVSSASTNIEPARLIDILRDHESAVSLVMDGIGRQRELTRGFMHEVHSVLTRNQPTYTAVDQFGNRHEVPLESGKFKQNPNNPTRPDGLVHEYCPPEQVDSEVDRLLGYLPGYVDEDPIVTAAWFHHRFTQIHPYTDGNGRVARTLTTLLLLRNELFPLVIDRSGRTEYIKALESADAGDLQPLVSLFVRLEKAAILQALSIDADSEESYQRSVTDAMIDALSDRFRQRSQKRQVDLSQVNANARDFRGVAHTTIERTLERLQDALAPLTAADVALFDGGTDHSNPHWYRWQIVNAAQEAKSFANFDEDHYFVKGTIRADQLRLSFVISCHHVGRVPSGIMQAIAFANLESIGNSGDDEGPRESHIPCSLEPFVFSHRTKVEEARESFGHWLDQCLAVAIKEFSERV
ncbi:MAG: Fic family protein [Chloroflexi bacterium]|nr:Fic family protein [Chloroflexota bacterium]